MFPIYILHCDNAALRIWLGLPTKNIHIGLNDHQDLAYLVLLPIGPTSH